MQHATGTIKPYNILKITLKRRDHLEYLGVDETIILK
jgi:hypothetical protein